MQCRIFQLVASQFAVKLWNKWVISRATSKFMLGNVGNWNLSRPFGQPELQTPCSWTGSSSRSAALHRILHGAFGFVLMPYSSSDSSLRDQWIERRLSQATTAASVFSTFLQNQWNFIFTLTTKICLVTRDLPLWQCQNFKTFFLPVELCLVCQYKKSGCTSP